MKGGTAVQTSQTKHTDSMTTKKVTITVSLIHMHKFFVFH